MFAPQFTHSFKSTRDLILILLLGLFLLGVHDGLSKNLSDDTLGIVLISQDLPTNGSIVMSVCNSSTGHNLSRVGQKNPVSDFPVTFITSFANDSINEDERIHLHFMPSYSSIQLVNNFTQQLAPVLFRAIFSDLSLKILSTVVFLH